MNNNNEYTSSIIFKYGDIDKVKQDVKTLNEILSRQGSSLFIDVLAEQSGLTANKFNMDADERALLIKNLLAEYHSSLSERL